MIRRRFLESAYSIANDNSYNRLLNYLKFTDRYLGEIVGVTDFHIYYK